VTDEAVKKDGEGRIEGKEMKQNIKIPGNAFSLILPKVHPGLCFMGTISRCVALYTEKAQPSAATDEEQIEEASLSVVTAS